LAAWLHGDTDTREALALAFDEAFRNWGFCSVRGYEELLPEAVITEARTQAVEFFKLPVDEKRRLARVDGVVGYLGPGEETVSDSVGAEAKVGKAQGDPMAKPPVKAAADPVESLNLPAYQEAGVTWEAATAAASCPWRAASYLPMSPTGFGSAAVAYFEGATKLMLELNQLMETALNLPRDHMNAPFERPGTLLRFAYYPPQPPNGGAASATAPGLRYGEHTDYDGFTILQRDGDDGLSGGLEIELSDGTWAPVPSLPGHLTINIGDLFARWTNDRWRATRHRVTLPKGTAAAAGRLSVVYFTGPHPDTVVSCLPSTKCKRLSGGPQYPPFKAGDHVRMKMLAATAAAREGTANGEGGTLV
jgi:isopenicillin N synthase-like dioxygenase